MVQHISCIFQDFVPQFLTAFFAGHTGYIGLAGSIGAGIKGSDIRILCGYNINLIKGDSCGLGCHLGEDGICTLSDFRSAHADLHRAVLV